MNALPFRLPYPAILHDWRIPFESALVPVGLFLGLATSLLMLSAFSVATPSCSGEDSMLVYPRYSKKGIVVDHTYVCGQPHKSCTAREAGFALSPTYDCSPFVLERMSLSWQ